MDVLDPSRINVILATDCGSTTTKAILIEKVDGHYRQTHRGEAPTTVEEPVADVTVGVINAATEVGELAGRRLVDDEGQLIRPARTSSDGKPEGCDIYISTSSAGGGLQMLVTGVVREMSAASAKRAALGAGAIVMDTISSNDKRRPHEQIQRIRELRPDMILMSGGTDGGTVPHVVRIAELIAPAKPRPRFGQGYQMPIIYAGNNEAALHVADTFDDSVALSVVDNVRPVLERENLGPARDAIHDLFLEHVMAHAPGYDKLLNWTDAPVMPTPGAVGDILQQIAKARGINAVGVDIGGATTDVFSVFDGVFNRTVSANLGMSYSISNVCAEAGFPNILRWVHVDMNERELRNRVKNKMIRPTTIPQTLEALVFEQAVSREALRLAYQQHKEFATTLKGVQQQRTVGDTFSQLSSGQSIVNNMTLNLLVASGGVLSHAPRHGADGDDDDRRLPARRRNRNRQGQHLHDAASRRPRAGPPGGGAGGLRTRLPDLSRRLRRAARSRQTGPALLSLPDPRQWTRRIRRVASRRPAPLPNRSRRPRPRCSRTLTRFRPRRRPRQASRMRTPRRNRRHHPRRTRPPALSPG